MSESDGKNRDRALCDRYPGFLVRPADASGWPAGRVGLEIGDGWLGLVDAVGEVLTAHAEVLAQPVPTAKQIKEKLGGLRVYTDGMDRFGSIAVSMATRYADRVCEDCGKPGRPHNAEGWLCTLCDEHAAARKARPQDLSQWTLPHLPDHSYVDFASVRASHAGVLAPAALLDFPVGWLDLADCALGFVAERNTQSEARYARIVRDVPGGITLEIGGALAVPTPPHAPYRVRRIVYEDRRLLCDIEPIDDESVAIADAVAALSRRVDLMTGAVRMLLEEEHDEEVAVRDPDARRRPGLFWVRLPGSPMPTIARFDAGRRAWLLTGQTEPLVERPVVLERACPSLNHLPTKSPEDALADAAAAGLPVDDDWVPPGTLLRERGTGREYLVIEVVCERHEAGSGAVEDWTWRDRSGIDTLVCVGLRVDYL